MSSDSLLTYILHCNVMKQNHMACMNRSIEVSDITSEIMSVVIKSYVRVATMRCCLSANLQ